MDVTTVPPAPRSVPCAPSIIHNIVRTRLRRQLLLEQDILALPDEPPIPDVTSTRGSMMHRYAHLPRNARMPLDARDAGTANTRVEKACALALNLGFAGNSDRRSEDYSRAWSSRSTTKKPAYCLFRPSLLPSWTCLRVLEILRELLYSASVTSWTCLH